ncbi:hypothetical protein DFJ74DRAFT_728364 [Hyaloraphidium curvatum]|nr:hypothetical protein DFJ74DRAFT_728364 [Hyaloraphidium curvatum]
MATLKTCLVAATAVLLFAAVIAPLAAASPVRAGQADAPKASPGRTVFRRSCAECASDDYWWALPARNATRPADGTRSELWAEGTPQGHVACVKYGSHEHLYRRYESAAVVSTFAGNRVCSNSGDSGLATDATLHGPFAICLDSSNNVYVSSGYSTIRKIDVTTNIITTYAGGNGMGSSGDGGPATSAQLNWPSMCAFDKDDNLLIAHYENRVRMVNRTSGIITTFAGDGTDGTSGDGGPATSAQVGWPWGVAVGSDNTVYIGQATGQRVRKVSGGQIDLLASIGNNPTALLEYDASNLLVATVNYVILQPTSGSAKAVFLGNGTKVDGGDGTTATTASVNEPYGLAKDPQGNVKRLYIAEESGCRVRMIQWS